MVQAREIKRRVIHHREQLAIYLGVEGCSRRRRSRIAWQGHFEGWIATRDEARKVKLGLGGCDLAPQPG